MTYPLEEGDFQCKVLKSLVRINHRLQALEKRTTKLAEAMVVDNSEEADFSPATTTAELIDLEKELASVEGSERKKKLKQAFRALALSVDDAREHAYSILDYLMTVNTQVFINMCYGNHVPGMNYTNRLSFANDLPKLLDVVVSSLSSKWPNVSEKKFKSIISERLRQAKKRAQAKDCRNDD